MKTHTMTTPVREVMTRAPITVTRDTTVGELMALFDHHDFNAFPVVDDGHTLSGIVTKLDVLRLLRPDRAFDVSDAHMLSSRRVADIMRHGVVSVEPDDPIVAVADLMVETRLRSLPVVQRKSGGPVLVGIVSQGDLLRGFRLALATGASRAGGSAADEPDVRGLARDGAEVPTPRGGGVSPGGAAGAPPEPRARARPATRRRGRPPGG
jgi:CBS domain-containing protein